MNDVQNAFLFKMSCIPQLFGFTFVLLT